MIILGWKVYARIWDMKLKTVKNINMKETSALVQGISQKETHFFVKKRVQMIYYISTEKKQGYEKQSLQ